MKTNKKLLTLGVLACAVMPSLHGAHAQPVSTATGSITLRGEVSRTCSLNVLTTDTTVAGQEMALLASETTGDKVAGLELNSNAPYDLTAYVSSTTVNASLGNGTIFPFMQRTIATGGFDSGDVGTYFDDFSGFILAGVGLAGTPVTIAAAGYSCNFSAAEDACIIEDSATATAGAENRDISYTWVGKPGLHAGTFEDILNVKLDCF